DNGITFDAYDEFNNPVLGYQPLANNKISASGNAYIFIDNRWGGVWFANGFRQTIDAKEVPTPEAALAVSPNPSKGQFTVSLELQSNAVVPVTVYDLLGRPVHSEKQELQAGSHQLNLNLEQLPAGTYLLQVGAASTRIVKQ
ncbi:MAG: T9SS type A sorting domain-containing protein, partial [Phaeodactylibacter sp.]|nr:T9SS type A sorting domain-containing protein [Phaeodactylibacter sp.]